MKNNDKITLDNILGYKEEKESIKKIITLLKDYDKYSKQGVSIPRGLIFQGPPGTGKTLFAKAIAGECGYKFFTALNEDENEENTLDTLKEIFKEAEKYSNDNNAPCLIYIDELDKITYLSNNDELYDKDARDATRFLLQKLDETKLKNKILIIASTNNYGRIPRALLRSGRFDKKLLIDVPNLESRKEILKYYINNHPLFKDIDIKRLALKTSGMSGADIKTLINNTLVEYITIKKRLDEDDFIKVINEMHFETIGKKWNTPKKILGIIVHEVGHSIVSGVLNNNYGEISAVRYGATAGSTVFDDMPEEEEVIDALSSESQDRNSIIKDIMISFGGMASEWVLLHEKSIGVFGDFNSIDNAIRFLFDCGHYGFEYTTDIARGTNSTFDKRKKLANKLCKKYFHKACRIVKKNKYLAYFLIEEVHKNNDVLSSRVVEEKINYYKEHKDEIINKYKKIKLENLLTMK